MQRDFTEIKSHLYQDRKKSIAIASLSLIKIRPCKLRGEFYRCFIRSGDISYICTNLNFLEVMRFVLVSLLFSLALTSVAQQFNSDYQTNMMFQNRPQGMMTSLTPAPAEKINSIYLYDGWSLGNIFLTDSTKLIDQYIKIDLKEKVLDIQYNQGVRIMPFSRILALELKTINGANEFYVIGASILDPNGVYKDQLFEIIKEGKVNLYCRTVASVLEKSYSPAMMPADGGRESEIVLKKKYLIVEGDDFLEIEGSKSKVKEELIRMFGSDIEPHLKKLNPKKEDDLINLVEKLNS